MFSAIKNWFRSEIGIAIAATLAIIMAVGFGAPVVVSAISDATAQGYTGKGVIQEHHIYGSFCNVTVKLENGNTQSFVAGPRPVCSNNLDGLEVTIDRGRLRK